MKPEIELPPLPDADAVWALVEKYADAVAAYNEAVRIDVGIDKAGQECLATEKELRALLARYGRPAEPPRGRPALTEADRKDLLMLSRKAEKEKGGLGLAYWHYAVAVLERYAAPQPAEPQECGCCGRSDGCDLDCDAAHPVEPVKVPSDDELIALADEVVDGITDEQRRLYAHLWVKLCRLALARYGQPAQPNPDTHRWQKARTLPRSWWRDALNRIAAEGVTLDELIDAEMRRKLP